MNKYAVFGAGLVTGLLAGFGVGYYVHKKKYEKELEAVNKSYHDIFEEQRKRIEEADAELGKGKVVTSPESILRPLEGSRSDSKTYKHNYTAYSENGVVEDPTMVIQHKSSIKEPEIPLEERLSDLHPMDSDEDEEAEKEEELYNEGLKASLEHEARRNMLPRIIKEEDYSSYLDFKKIIEDIDYRFSAKELKKIKKCALKELRISLSLLKQLNLVKVVEKRGREYIYEVVR